MENFLTLVVSDRVFLGFTNIPEVRTIYVGTRVKHAAKFPHSSWVKTFGIDNGSLALETTCGKRTE